ncbi:MAG: bacteriohemerythrin [Gemmatimonadetes bacterium]|nr:bacteriohemerythrin [Gemmatimonadota bacterium]MCA9769641.1 bacteriohemerythrin [Gemmatimonadota bacterium]MCB9519021.1 bacteriohemerythrin [Gemmatimonadales bacterium]
MKWTEAYRTGIPELDAQHRTLFQMSEDFQATIAEGRGARSYGEFLASLRLYVKAHFGIEEDCMFRHRCPAYAANRRAHAGFSLALADLEARFQRDGYSATAAQGAMELVDQWLHDHVRRIDAQLRPLAEQG